MEEKNAASLSFRLFVPTSHFSENDKSGWRHNAAERASSTATIVQQQQSKTTSCPNKQLPTRINQQQPISYEHQQPNELDSELPIADFEKLTTDIFFTSWTRRAKLHINRSQMSSLMGSSLSTSLVCIIIIIL